MSNWKLEDNVTSLSDSQLLAEIGVMEGIPFDALWNQSCAIEEQSDNQDFIIPGEDIKAYRLDKLLSVLPLPVDLYQEQVVWGEERLSKIDLYYGSFQRMRDLRGQPAIKAVVQLIKLLHEEGLLDG